MEKDIKKLVKLGTAFMFIIVVTILELALAYIIIKDVIEPAYRIDMVTIQDTFYLVKWGIYILIIAKTAILMSSLLILAPIPEEKKENV